MAVDQELSALTAVASLLPTDIIYLVRDPGGGAEADNKAPVSVLDARYATAAQGSLAATALQAAAIGVSVQAYDAGLSAITAFGRSLIDDVDAAAGRGTLVAAGTGVANTFTAAQKINVNSTAALFVEQDGVKNDVLVVDTTNGRVGVGTAAPSYRLHVSGETGIRITEATAIARIRIENNFGNFAFFVGANSANNFGMFNYVTNKYAMWIDAANKVGFGNDNTIPAAQVHIKQESTNGTIPTLRLDQLDISEDFIEFNGVVAAGNPIEAVGAKTLTTTHFLRVSVNGSFVYIPVGTIA